MLELYEMETYQKKSMPKYQKLKTMVMRRKDRKLRLRNFDATNDRIETGAAVTSRRGLSGVKRGQSAINGKQKDSVREETSVVSGTMKMSVQSRHQKPFHLLNHQNQEFEVFEKKEPQRLDSIWKFARQPCKDYLKGNLHQITL